MSRLGMMVTVIATRIAQAVTEDEKPENGGCDISAGLYGPNLSAFIRETAETLTQPPDFRAAILKAAERAYGHAVTAQTDDQLLTLLQNVADAAHYARAHSA